MNEKRAFSIIIAEETILHTSDRKKTANYKGIQKERKIERFNNEIVEKKKSSHFNYLKKKL